jgi:hypothetical protein
LVIIGDRVYILFLTGKKKEKKKRKKKEEEEANLGFSFIK